MTVGWASRLPRARLTQCHKPFFRINSSIVPKRLCPGGNFVQIHTVFAATCNSLTDLSPLSRASWKKLCVRLAFALTYCTRLSFEKIPHSCRHIFVPEGHATIAQRFNVGVN